MFKFNRSSLTSKVPSLVVAAGVCAAIGLGTLAMTSGGADARVKSGTKGQLAATCTAYQDDYDRTMAELAKARAAGDYQKAYQLRLLLGTIHDYWDTECAGTFGSIAYLVVSPAATDGTGASQSGGVVISDATPIARRPGTANLK